MDMAKLMREAQAMQEKIAAAQESAQTLEANGVAGAGLVTVTLKGKGDLVSIRIDPSLMSESADILEDLIKAAHNEARRNLEQAVEQAMQKITQDMGGMMPGFKMPF